MGLLNLFVTKMTNVYFIQIIKLNREAIICLFIISRLLIVFFFEIVVVVAATEADILNTTYHVNLL